MRRQARIHGQWPAERDARILENDTAPRAIDPLDARLNRKEYSS
jgi:hypothetical protein